MIKYGKIIDKTVMLMTPEILAPVGGREQLLAAVRCGADAVYLGTKGFNARRNAENFEGSSLADDVAYCHSRGVKVHVTVNTLVMDDETEDLVRTVDEVAASGADAVIVQDLAVMELIRRRYPTLAIHASTQCAVHNTKGVRLMEELGCSRVVLARELSLDEIKKIRAATSVELESFIHGALCMSLSGSCYLSSVIGGRSGNRGLCAQPCRLDFKCGGRDYALSLKDMSHIKHVRELADAGVCSFKIEGRMKRAEYVAAAVTACRLALEGRDYDESALRSVFSRSGFTDGYLTGKRDMSMFGRREKEDVVAAKAVLGDLARLYDREKQTVSVDMALTIPEDGGAVLTAKCGGETVTVTGDAAIPARSQPTGEEHARKALSKSGGTQYRLENLTVSNPAGLMLPPSVMNDMRRRALEELDALRGAPRPHECTGWTMPAAQRYTPPEKARLWGRFEKYGQVPDPDFYDRIILPLDEIDAHREIMGALGDRLIGELPPVCFPDDEDRVAALARELTGAGLPRLWAENAYAVALARDLGVPVCGGAYLNVTSTAALREYEKLGLEAVTVSFELQMKKIAALGGGIKRGFIGYGYLPVMRMRSCPARNKGCGSCDGRPRLTDRLGVEFPMMCQGRRYTTLLNSVPLNVTGHPMAKCDFTLMYFTIESGDECRRVTEDFLLGRESGGQRTGGLYYRQLL